MSADSFHHSVEEEIRKKKSLYDFDDFVECVQNQGIAIVMNAESFSDFKNEKGCGKDIKVPYLKNICEIQFRKGSTKIFWKESFEETVHRESEFLKKKSRKEFIYKWKPYPRKGEARGIEQKKKEDILSKLGPLLKPGKLRFWENIPSNINSKDLTISIDHLPK